MWLILNMGETRSKGIKIRRSGKHLLFLRRGMIEDVWLREQGAFVQTLACGIMTG